MAYYPDVNSGDKVRPIAALENELRHIVNAQNGFLGSAGSVRNVQTLTVPVFNSDTETIKAGFPASFIAPETTNAPEVFLATGAIPVMRYTNSTRWGVVTSPIAPGEFGTAVVTGVVKVKFTGSGSPATLAPAVDGFRSNGDVMCIYSAADSAVIVLGAGGESEYKNYFQVVAEKHDDNGRLSQVKIIDGAQPELDFSGYTDVGGVSSGVVDVPGNGFVVLVLIRKYREWVQEFRFLSWNDFHETDFTVPYFVLAQISDSKIIQRWTGGMIYWRTRFIIPQKVA